MQARNIFLGLSSLLMIAAIPVAVYLASEQQVLRSQAYSPTQVAEIKITGSNVIDQRAVKPDVTLAISYPKNILQPDVFRVANNLSDLDQAPTVNFTPPTQNLPWQLDITPQTPTVYLQFRINNQWQTPLFASIPYLPINR